MTSNDGRVDLHVHTTFSDGDMTPEEMVREAQKRGLAGIGIADHDEIGGAAVAMEAAGSSGFEVVAAVELSTSDSKTDVHVLGFMIDLKNENLLSYLKLFRDARLRRGLDMVERLRGMGLALDPDLVLEIANGGSVGRPHVAEALLRSGFVESYEEAFRKYIGFDSPAYVPKYQLKPNLAFQLIAEAGGVGAIAHPGTLRRDDLITEFMTCGMRALEVFHPKHNERSVAHYQQLADKMGLVATGGSDTHGRRDGNLLLGSCTVPYSTIDELRRARSY
ncbi:MAG TPA: PHP domain-containing protein [bacterium]|nr:PHP domain-containing protein [bacterium]